MFKYFLKRIELFFLNIRIYLRKNFLSKLSFFRLNLISLVTLYLIGRHYRRDIDIKELGFLPKLISLETQNQIYRKGREARYSHFKGIREEMLDILPLIYKTQLKEFRVKENENNCFYMECEYSFRYLKEVFTDDDFILNTLKVSTEYIQESDRDVSEIRKRVYDKIIIDLLRNEGLVEALQE